jgi:hypothetical protein
MKAALRGLLLLVCALGWLPAAYAHVGSKDVYETVHAGPYTLDVTVRPPNVIPGVATVEVRTEGPAVTSLEVTPLPVTGEASKHPPAADVMKASNADPAFYTGAVWMMAGGTWQVRFDVDGAAGKQQATVPVVAVSLSVMKMDKGMGTVLGLLGLFLAVSFAGIVAASFQEARLQPGVEPSPAMRRVGRLAVSGGLVFAALAIMLGGWWWNAEAASYAEHIYHPLPLGVTLTGNELRLKIAVYKPLVRRGAPLPEPKDTLLLDHGKAMHLYAIREPQMDVAFHLHPAQNADGTLSEALPAMPPGHYQLYGDVVHGSGFPETLLGTLDVPAGMNGGKLDPEDAEAVITPISAGPLGTTFRLPDGYAMVWDKPAQLKANQAYRFTFHLVDAAGKPATGMQPYLGMAGHAAFVKTDGSVFAHTHPEGSAAMADVMLANESLPGASAMPAAMDAGPIGPTVSFPYGFPSAGRYRIFIQMKHGGTVETGVFDADVK